MQLINSSRDPGPAEPNHRSAPAVNLHYEREIRKQGRGVEDLFDGIGHAVVVRIGIRGRGEGTKPGQLPGIVQTVVIAVQDGHPSEDELCFKKTPCVQGLFIDGLKLPESRAAFIEAMDALIGPSSGGVGPGFLVHRLQHAAGAGGRYQSESEVAPALVVRAEENADMFTNERVGHQDRADSSLLHDTHPGCGIGLDDLREKVAVLFAEEHTWDRQELRVQHDHPVGKAAVVVNDGERRSGIRYVLDLLREVLSAAQDQGCLSAEACHQWTVGGSGIRDRQGLCLALRVQTGA